MKPFFYKKAIIILAFVAICSFFSASMNENIYTVSDNTETVYVTAKGSCYHRRRSCPSLSRSKSVSSMDISSARAKGYRACSKCM